ncbi:MAG: 2Fe-2S iron-sulfur cluster-binding protein [Chloroherpetonaceae bacterium]
MKLKLNIWRQESALAKGAFKTYTLDNLEKDMSFLEMLDVLNERLVLQGERPVVFDHDCREGICGTCGLMINGRAALFTSAKISHLAKLPQGRAEARTRVVKMVEQMDKEGFGHCTNTEACEVECPMGVSVLNIAQMNWEYNKALLLG